MMRLQKFEEQGPGDTVSRVAYVMKPETLPAPADGSAWRPVASFSAADEVLADPGLVEIFKGALLRGFAVVDKTS
jgi:hypothetical protein